MDDDEIFEQMTDGLDIATDADISPASELSNFELVKAFNSAKEELRETRESLNPHTEHGKDLQSQYYGYLIEMRKRGIT